MSRRLFATAIAAASLVGTVPSSYADGTADLPRATCDQRVNDIGGDAVPNWNTTSPDTPISPSSASVPALDIKNVDLRLTDTKLEVYLHVADAVPPTGMGQLDTTYQYTVTFVGNLHNFTFSYAEFNTATPHDKLHGTDIEKRADSGTGTNNAFTGFTAGVDPATDYVTWTVDRSQVERNLGGPLLDGDQFTSIAAQTWQKTASLQHPADSTNVTGDAATYTVGNDFCFGAPPAALSALKTPTVQYTDTVPLSATLVSESGDPLADHPVDFTVAGEPAVLHATTNGSGVATAQFKPSQGAGKYAVTAVYPGDATDGKARLAGTITVTAEVTTLGTPTVTKTSSTSRTVTATLLDNDKKPVAGQKVAWYVNGKKVATLTTDSKGKTVFKGAKPGQTVQAKFSTVTGKYTGCSSKAVTA
jgi:hypothetical protein